MFVVLQLSTQDTAFEYNKIDEYVDEWHREQHDYGISAGVWCDIIFDYDENLATRATLMFTNVT